MSLIGILEHFLNIVQVFKFSVSVVTKWITLNTPLPGGLVLVDF